MLLIVIILYCLSIPLVFVATKHPHSHHNSHVTSDGLKNATQPAVPYDNPTSIIQAYSGPDPGYIIAESGKYLLFSYLIYTL